MRPIALLTDSGIDGPILRVDRFGNLVTNICGADVPRAVTATWRAGRGSRRVESCGEAGPEEVVLIGESSGLFELAVKFGSAAEVTGVERSDAVVFSEHEE